MTASGFEQRPDYRVDIHRRRNTITAELTERLIARTTRALLVDEQDHGLVFYFPRSDVLVDLRRDAEQTSRCPYKGIATYWRFDDDGGESVCWSYDDPHDEVGALRWHVAFYQDKVAVRVGQAHPAIVGYES